MLSSSVLLCSRFCVFSHKILVCLIVFIAFITFYLMKFLVKGKNSYLPSQQHFCCFLYSLFPVYHNTAWDSLFEREIKKKASWFLSTSSKKLQYSVFDLQNSFFEQLAMIFCHTNNVLKILYKDRKF